MSPTRNLSVLVAVLTACVVAVIVLAGDGDDGGGDPPAAAPPGPLARALLELGEGPAGSRAVALARWRYRGDPDARGAQRGWADGGFGGREVTVPHSPNARRVLGPGSRRAYRGSVGWFQRKIVVPVDGEYALAFESAHHKAVVYVDGRRARSHVGAYEPFAARLRLRRGEHTVVVRADWRRPRRQADAGYDRAWFNYGGLNRPVTLARLGAHELGALNVATRLRESGTARVRVRVRVRNRSDAARRVRARGTLSREGERLRLRFDPARIGPDASESVTATVNVRDPALWSPAEPSRYRLEIAVPGEAKVSRLVGLREIEWGGEDGALRLNGEPLRLRGAALPPDARGSGDAMSPDDEKLIVDQLRATGANATRSQLPLSHSMLARLDAAGILVWQEIGPWEPAGAWRAKTPERIAEARDRALRTAEAQQAHPSILTWTLTNEAAGSGQPEQQAYVTQTAARLRDMDPTRPVAVDLWGRQVTRAAGPLFDAVDAIGVTDYVGWYEGLDEDAEGQATLARERLDRLRRLFPGKPLVVTELGAAGTRRIPDFEFGGLQFHADLLARRLDGLEQVPGLTGTLIWNLRDYALRPDFRGGSVLDLRPELDLTPGLNEKGLYDFRGRTKPALDAVREAFSDG